MATPFDNLRNKLADRPNVRKPNALAASIGRKKYGRAGMASKAAAGRKRHQHMSNVDKLLAAGPRGQ